MGREKERERDKMPVVIYLNAALYTYLMKYETAGTRPLCVTAVTL